MANLVELYYNDELYPDFGEQGHEACLFNPGQIQKPIVEATLLVRQNGYPNLLYRCPTRNIAIETALTLEGFSDNSGPLLFKPNMVYAADSKTPEIVLAKTGQIELVLLRGHQTHCKKPHILVKPTQITRLLNLTLENIHCELTDEQNVYRLT